VTTFTYDLRRLPESMSTRVGSASPLHDLAYAWGDARQLISETRGHEGRADVFAYDKAYRMTATGLGQPPATEPALDGKNVLTLSIGRVNTIDGGTRKLDGTPTSFTNETTPRHRYSLFLGQSHEQDSAGNEVRNGRGQFEWDARNRLVKATTHDGTALEYGYDGLGRRVERRQTTSGVTISSRFGYDGFEPIAEWTCGTCDPAAPTYSLFREYVPSGSVDRPLELITHSGAAPSEERRLLLFGNVAGSLSLVTDENGRPVERVRYLPHGTPIFDAPVTVRSVGSPSTGGLDVGLLYEFDPATVTALTVRVLTEEGVQIPATVSPDSDGRTIRIRDAALTDGSRIRVVLATALTDRWGGSNGVDSPTMLVYRTSETLFERQDYALDRTSRFGLSRLWQGLEYEPAIGLYYVRHRWYDPETGSFLSADPLGFPDGMNQYTWPYANPWKQDPWGLESWTSDQIADRYYAESKKYGALAAIRNEALRRGLNAEQDAQSAAGRPWWKRGLSAIGGLFGSAKATDQRIENAVGEAARDLTRNVVPPSTAPVDRTHRIPTEYGGGPTQSDRIASAANGLSETAGDVAEGGARGGYQAGRDWFLVSGLGTVLNEARAARAARRELPTLEIDYRRYPDLAENIWHAQKAGRPDVLTHGGIPRVNRAAATKPVPNLSPWSRDEYPFASSLEGGEGAWVGHIPVEQQNAQGALIKNFVTGNGVRPGEQYRVLVTNHPFGE
jgi:RHS repeat-associated protein